VSILVNNAGVAGPVAALTDVSVEDWDQVFAVNVRGTFLQCRALLPGMISRGDGDVINVASVSGKRPLAHRTPYTASKMAVIGLTSTLAFEVGTSGVRVNTLTLAGVWNDQPADFVEAYSARVPMGRMGRAEEVATVVHFLASDEASFVTGQCYDVSGGRATY
jgi:NAD(P)-dependent dehydrogenase (short-subunit alcohol dehydrogenase family)